jgi:nucleotide-binding universal stress UspA family protein
VYERILIPTDGSEEMDAVVEEGLELAAMTGADLHVLHVVDERAVAAVPDDARGQVKRTLEADARDATKTVADRADERGVDAEEAIEWGNAPASIIEHAGQHDVDCIVMGTHGRTGYEQFLLGSVAEKVVRVAPIPVHVVHVGDDDWADVGIPGV